MQCRNFMTIVMQKTKETLTAHCHLGQERQRYAVASKRIGFELDYWKQKMRNDVDNGKYESYYDFRQTKTNSNRSNKVRSKSINKLISFAFISTNL